MIQIGEQMGSTWIALAGSKVGVQMAGLQSRSASKRTKLHLTTETLLPHSADLGVNGAHQGGQDEIPESERRES